MDYESIKKVNQHRNILKFTRLPYDIATKTSTECAQQIQDLCELKMLKIINGLSFRCIPVGEYISKNEYICK